MKTTIEELQILQQKALLINPLTIQLSYVQECLANVWINKCGIQTPELLTYARQLIKASEL